MRGLREEDPRQVSPQGEPWSKYLLNINTENKEKIEFLSSPNHIYGDTLLLTEQSAVGDDKYVQISQLMHHRQPAADI